MKKTVLVIAVTLFAVAMLATPLVTAVPLKEKNNDKFLPFHVDLVVSGAVFVAGEHNFIPSMDKVNKLTVDGPETFIKYDIKVGSTTYKQNVDFIYTGSFEYVFYDVTAWWIIPGVLDEYDWPAPDGYRARHFTVDYSLEFLPVSGIEGTIQMKAVSASRGWMTINSLSGTGDLQNVQIKAVVSGEGPAAIQGVYWGTHDGTVTGWPT